MVRMNLIGGGFQGDPSSTYQKESKFISWDYNSKTNPVSFYVDYQMFDAFKDRKDGKRKFGWTMESAFIVPGLIERTIELESDLFDVYEAIFTHDRRLLDRDERYKWLPAYGTWIKDIHVRPKSKLVSMITSSKLFTPQHNVRLNFAKSLPSNVDLYGRGIRPILNKEEGLDDYMFSVAIENGSYPTYFTEKFTDCLATGTVPIYMGAPDIGEHFDKSGIIVLDDSFSFESLSEDLYYSMFDAVNRNSETVRNYDVLEDWLWKNWLRDMV